MGSEQLEKLIKDKIEEALKNSEHPKKFFITANGRGVTDGGDLYNALLKDAKRVRQSLDKPKHYNWSYKYHKSWKRQYKVKHQYEIHLDPHEDRGYFNKRKYDEEMLLDVI